MKNFSEIKELLKNHKKEFKEKYQIKDIGIFGSYARGLQNKTSDIDILVTVEKTCEPSSYNIFWELS